MEREPQRVFSAEETEFLNHYKRNFQERVDAITLKHLSGELDNPDVLNAVKNKLKTDYNKSWAVKNWNKVIKQIEKHL